MIEDNIIFTIVFIILYGWSSKIIKNKELYGIKKYSEIDILSHTESKNWILGSGVCTLGKISFFLWSIALIINLFIPLNKNTLILLAFLTITITLVLNTPLFIRSVPAFIVLFIIIYK